jgi:2-keto-3-deoxy-L-rhamnonate aldolase RhmA
MFANQAKRELQRSYCSSNPWRLAMATEKLGKILKDKLLSGQTVYGTLIQHATNPALVDFIPEGALDFVIVTAEHNALDIADFLPLRYALANKGIACLARTHSRAPDDVSKVCDSFDGVVVPYVEDIEHAKRLAAAAVYRPLKGKALTKVLEEGIWPSEKTRRYIAEERCADTVFIPMIESVLGVENVEAICAIPGVNALFIGPNDLTTNMGIPNEYDSPELTAMIQRVIDVADRSHVAAGCWFGKPEQSLRTKHQGARLIVYSNDSSMLKDAMALAFGRLRNE